MQLSIRRATAKDSKFLSWVILEASHSHLGDNYGLWNLVFPESEEDRVNYLEKLILSNHVSFCHYSLYLIAEVNGEPTAALAGFDPGLVTDDNFINAIVDVLPKPMINPALSRMAPYTTCLIEPDKDSWVIDMVAVKPGYIQLGLCKKLLKTSLKHGLEAGFNKSEILILIGNLAAQKLYEKLGFRTVEEKKHPEFEKALNCPGVARMIIDKIHI